MRVVSFVINYRTDEHVARFIESTARALTAAPQIDFQLHVLDNSEKDDRGLAVFRAALGGMAQWAEVRRIERNKGYFGPLSCAQSLVPAGTDYVMYGNADILLESDFFSVLARLRPSGGIIAPSILTVEGSFDQNPLYRTRLSAAKLRRLRAVYSNGAAFRAYCGAGALKERLLSRGGRPRLGSRPDRDIYAGHGALFVFADVGFFLALPEYPVFLYGEELFVAEEARLRGVSWVYEPELLVRDERHASISQLTSDRRRAYLHESISYILSRYYPDGYTTP